ncbi:MAG: hypothetical protein RL385_5992 [Pseudomonadota bacterium]|jgi:DNA-directed RNA polymerase specialized sigma24 family protein
MSESVDTPKQKNGPRGPATNWTELKLAAQAETAGQDAKDAFHAFCLRYHSVVYGYFIKQRCSPAQAEDLAQKFFLRRLIERGDLAKVKRELGKFRGWLRTSLDRFLIDEWRMEKPLDVEFEEAHFAASSASLPSFELLYAIKFATGVLEKSHTYWAERFARRGVLVDEATFVRWLVSRDAISIAATLDILPDNARQTLHRLHEDLWRLFEKEVAQTVPADCVAEELEYICTVLGIRSPRDPELLS